MLSYVFIGKSKIEKSPITMHLADPRIEPAICYNSYKTKYKSEYPMFLLLTIGRTEEENYLYYIEKCAKYLNSYEHLVVLIHKNIITNERLEGNYVGISLDTKGICSVHRYIIIKLMAIMLRFFSKDEHFLDNVYINKDEPIQDAIIKLNNSYHGMGSPHSLYEETLTKQILDFLLDKEKMEEKVIKVFGKINPRKVFNIKASDRQTTLIKKLISKGEF